MKIKIYNYHCCYYHGYSIIFISSWILTIATLIMPLLALGTFKHFRFLFEKSIGAIFNAGIKVAVISFIISIVNPLLTDMVNNYQAIDGFNMAGLLQIVFGCFVIAMLVLKVPNLAQGLINGSPNLSGGDMYAPMQATSQIAHGATAPIRGVQTAGKALGTFTAASQMEGGRQAMGVPWLAGTVKQIAGQMKSGQYKGSLQSGKDYLSGVAGTFGNRMKMAAAGTFKSPYYEAMRNADNKIQTRSDYAANNELYTQQNTNPDAKDYAQTSTFNQTKAGQIQKKLKDVKENKIPNSKNIIHNDNDDDND